ncbi:MAG: hypothetical protein AB1772_01685 [Candidatus Zixiibacteriota bacterium]
MSANKRDENQSTSSAHVGLWFGLGLALGFAAGFGPTAASTFALGFEWAVYLVAFALGAAGVLLAQRLLGYELVRLKK